MFKNYLKIAGRNLVKYKVYSLINISGLAISLALAVFIFLWVNDELSYDDFHLNADQIYRIVIDYEGGWSKTCGGLANELVEKYPDILNAVRFRFWGSFGKPQFELTWNNQKYKGFEIYADPSVFNVFTFPFIQGNPQTAFENQNAIVITEKFAERMFADAQPIGKTVECAGEQCVVTGVIHDIPSNSHLQFDWIRPFSVVEKMWGTENVNGWESWEFWTYLLINKKASIPNLDQKIFDTIKEHDPEWNLKVHLQPLKNIYLHSTHFQYDIGVHGDFRYVMILSLIAFLIIVIACTNFINLAVARSSNRVKEVAIKKVMGSTREQLFFQFQTEFLLLGLIGFSAALIIVEIFLPIFNDLTVKSLSLNLFAKPTLTIFFGAFIFAGFITGLYPTLLISSFRPTNILGHLSKPKSLSFKKSLVIFQFAISIIAIICMTVIGRQVHFMQNKNLGFEKDNIICFSVNGAQYQTIRNELLKDPDIISVGASEAPLYAADIVESGIQDWEGNQTKKGIQSYVLKVGADFLDTYRMKISEGRFFSGSIQSDLDNAVVVNETAIKQMGLMNPIHKSIRINEKKYKIIGIIRDFNFKSLYSSIEPMVLTLSNWENWPPTMGVRIRADNTANTIAFIRQTYEKIIPERSFEYHFLDNVLSNSYKKEDRIAVIFQYSAIIALFISALGLLGLASITSEQRTKEISVRRVIGASVSDIVFMLTKRFTVWVFLANIFAWPIAWYVMNQWLQNFAYRIEISWWMFELAGALALMIALLTVSGQAIKAAMANPVVSLRYE